MKYFTMIFGVRNRIKLNTKNKKKKRSLNGVCIEATVVNHHTKVSLMAAMKFGPAPKTN